MVAPLLHRYLLEWARGAGIIWSWLVAGGVMLGVLSGGYQMDLLFTQPYMLGLMLGLIGLLGLERMARAGQATRRGRAVWAMAGSGLLLLALWVNLAGVVVLGSAFAWKQISGGGWRRERQGWAWVQAVVLGGVYLLADGLRRFAESRSEYGWLPMDEWPGGAWTLLQHANEAASPATIPTLLGLALIGLLVGGWRGETAAIRRTVVQAGACVGLAALYLAVVSANEHVRSNGTAYRYALPAFVLLLTAGAMTSGLAISSLRGSVRGALTAALAALVVWGAVQRHGPPSYAETRRFVDQKFDRGSDELLESGATLVLGQYWDVWHTVFHANLRRYESDQPMTIYGLAHRGDVTRPLWSPLPVGARIAVPRTPESEAEVAFFVRHFGLPALRKVQETPRFTIYATLPGG